MDLFFFEISLLFFFLFSSDKIATGSFDKTCKLWSTESGKCYHTFKGHNAEIVCLAFNPQSTALATGSMDNTAKIWDIETGKELCSFSVKNLKLNSKKIKE